MGFISSALWPLFINFVEVFTADFDGIDATRLGILRILTFERSHLIFGTTVGSTLIGVLVWTLLPKGGNLGLFRFNKAAQVGPPPSSSGF